MTDNNILNKNRILMQGRSIQKKFGGQVILDSVDFNLHEGEVVLLQGSNGSGKTTLLNILTGNVVPDSGTISLMANGYKEDFVFPRRWWQNLNPFDHFLPECVSNKGVGRSWQETRLFPSIQLIDNIMVAEPKHPGENPLNVLFNPGKIRRWEHFAKDKAISRLNSLGLSGRTTSSGDKISLGQAKRVSIARAVQGGAKILFLDEPLSGLDTEGITTVIELLRSLVKEHRMTIIIIEHLWNVCHVAPIADTIWKLNEGRLSITSNHTNTISNNSNEKESFRVSDLFPEYKLSRTINLQRGAQIDIYRRLESISPPILKIENLTITLGNRMVIGYDEDKIKMKGICLSLKPGDLAILQAPNGWGKTTLMDTLAGLLPVSNGTIQLDDKDITHCPTWKRVDNGLRYLRSNSRGFTSLCVKDILQLSGNVANVTSHMHRIINSFYGQLSGGEKKNIKINSLKSEQASLFILDEPFSALDEESISNAVSIIPDLISDSKKSMLIALPSTTKNGVITSNDT